jgi:hypothetical protein
VGEEGGASLPRVVGSPHVINRDAAESETLSMRGNSTRENRETPPAPLPITARDGRRGLQPYVRHRGWDPESGGAIRAVHPSPTECGGPARCLDSERQHTRWFGEAATCRSR